jgi:hypothetical protein
MNPRAQMRRRGLLQFWAAVGVAILLLVAYTYIYVVGPFSDVLNAAWIDAFPAIGAALGTLFAVLVWRSYERDDEPRRVWRWFAIALAFFTVAEILWGYLDVSQGYGGQVPVGWPDVFWVAAYPCFGVALYFQYHLLLRFATESGLRMVALSYVVVLVGTAVLTFLLDHFAMQPFSAASTVDAFYPVADLAVGLAALWLVRRFHNGALGFNWLGLFVFAIADSLYAWLSVSGTYDSWSAQPGNLLSTSADVSYLTAYLIVGLGCFTQWLLLRYGPIFRREAREP